MATYKANHAEFAMFMIDYKIQHVLEDVGEKMADRMREFAPKRTGEYASRFRVELGFDLRKRDRAAAFVINDSRQAAALEAGSYNIKNPPQPMRRGLNASVR